MGGNAEDSDIEEEFHAVLDKIKTEDIKTEPDSDSANSYGNEPEIIILEDDRRSGRPLRGLRAPKLTLWRAAKKRPGAQKVPENLNLNRSTKRKTYKGPKSRESQTIPKARAEPSTLCRLCATCSFVTVPIFGKDKIYKNIVQKIEHCLSVVVKRTDTLPQRVCRDCLEKLEFCHNFHESVAQAEIQLTILDNKRSNGSRTAEEEARRLVPITPTANEEEINVPRHSFHSSLKRKRMSEEIPRVRPMDDNFLSTLRLDWDELIPVQSDGDIFGDGRSELFYDPLKIKLGRRFAQRESCVQLKEMLQSSEKLGDYRVRPSRIVRTYRARHKTRQKADDDDVIICYDGDSVDCRFCGAILQTTEKRYAHERAHIATNLYPCVKCKRSFDSEREWTDHKNGEGICETTSEKKFLAESRPEVQYLDEKEEFEVKEAREIREREEQTSLGICYRNWEELEADDENYEDDVEIRCDRRTPRAKGGYTCDHCGNCFLMISTLQMHMENHVGTKRPYEYQNHR